MNAFNNNDPEIVEISIETCRLIDYDETQIEAQQIAQSSMILVEAAGS